jgi:HSP20 family protein
VTQTNSILTVRGARRFKKANEEAVYHSSERNYGTFERLFPLPGNILAERIKSKFTNGILQITIPKTKADLSGRSEE